MANNKSYFYLLTGTQEQQLLEMYDACNRLTNAMVTDDVKYFESNGMLSMTSIHWFELVIEYILPVLLDKNYMAQNTFYTRCLQFRLEHPIDFLYIKYQVIMAKELIKAK